jgi:hypothetical protein
MSEMTTIAAARQFFPHLLSTHGERLICELLLIRLQKDFPHLKHQPAAERHQTTKQI